MARQPLWTTGLGPIRRLPPLKPKLSVTVRVGEGAIEVVLNEDAAVALPKSDPVRCKLVLLSLLNAKLVSPQQVSQALGLSHRHIRSLKAKLASEGSMALLDQRRGQQQEYRITPEVKGEIAQQFVVNAVAGRKTSGNRLAEDLKERCALQVAPRTIRRHASKLGLKSIRDSLAALVAAAKKTPEHGPRLLWRAGAGV